MVRVYKNESYKKEIQETYRELVKAWNVDVNERNVDGKYGTTHVIEFGDASLKPLVLFHGVGDDSALMWIFNAKELSKHFHVLAIDTIGGPGLSVPGSGYNKEFDDVSWIDELLEHFSLNKVFMAGVSNGGYLVQMYMIFRPERVEKAISMAGTIPVSTGKNAMSAMFRIFMPEALVPTQKNTEKLIRKMTGLNYKVFVENELVFRHFSLLMKGFNRRAMLCHKVKPFALYEIDAIRSRMLYIAGRMDPFMKLGGGELLDTYHMNTLWLEDAGHGINHEMAEEVNKAIIEFLG